jgi:hypothetical protein
MSAIRSFTIGEREWSGVGQRVNALQQLNYEDGLFGVHDYFGYFTCPPSPGIGSV